MCISVVAMVFKLFPICLVITLLPNVGFTQDGPVSVSNSSLNDIESYELQIMNLESAHGPMDQRLIEPLNGLITRLTELGQIDQVAELQTKQLAIMLQRILALWPRTAISKNCPSQSGFVAMHGNLNFSNCFLAPPPPSTCEARNRSASTVKFCKRRFLKFFRTSIITYVDFHDLPFQIQQVTFQ